jgi:hypothetical protein
MIFDSVLVVGGKGERSWVFLMYKVWWERGRHMGRALPLHVLFLQSIKMGRVALGPSPLHVKLNTK